MSYGTPCGTLVHYKLIFIYWNQEVTSKLSKCYKSFAIGKPPSCTTHV